MPASTAASTSTSSQAGIEHLTNGGTDALGRLAGSVGRPRSSLQAFSRLSEEQLMLLAGAVEATVERRRSELDAALGKALFGPPGRALRRLLERDGSDSLRGLVGRRRS